MKHHAKILMAAVLCWSASVFAAGGISDAYTDASVSADPRIAAAQAAIAQKDWGGAQSGLQKALESSPQNADYHNLYAYSIRKGTSPNMELVFKHYGEALKINPKHRGAHEYLGEAYLMVNDLPKAKQHLAALDKLCFLPCGEYNDLKKSVAAYEAKRRP